MKDEIVIRCGSVLRKANGEVFKRGDYKVLVNYSLAGVAVSQSLYTGPHRKHADRAFVAAGVLGRHGVLTDCTVSFFDGCRIRYDLTKRFGNPERGGAA